MTRVQIFFVAASLLAGLNVSPRIDAQQARWYKGNTHVHGVGEGYSPEEVAGWYASHGYDFIVSTEHEKVLDVDAIRLDRKDFVIIPGQEIGQAVDVADPLWPAGIHFHVNALNIPKVILPVGLTREALDSGKRGSNWPPRDVTPAEAYQRNIDGIYAAGGVPQVNHPNLQWSVRPEHLLPITKPFLLEVWNAFPTSNNLGGVDNSGRKALSTEELWDVLLSNGKIVWATATDDTHDYRNFDKRETTPTPGKAWIVVSAATLSKQAITSALRDGRFYASTGVTLERYEVDGKSISMKIAQVPDWNPALPGSAFFLTRFIGANGKVLAEVTGETPRYVFNGDETYVRASIIDSDGRRGWTQPVFFDSRATSQP